jgi:hypothetical protein
MARLESRMDDPVSIVQSAAKSPGLPADMRRVLNKEEVFKVTTDVDKYVELTATADSPSLALSSSSPVRLGGSSNPSPPPPYKPSADEAEAYLGRLPVPDAAILCLHSYRPPI